jgi:hypothetical protein
MQVPPSPSNRLLCIEPQTNAIAMMEPLPNHKRTIYVAIAVLLLIGVIVWAASWVAYIFGGDYIQ